MLIVSLKKKIARKNCKKKPRESSPAVFVVCYCCVSLAISASAFECERQVLHLNVVKRFSMP